MDEPAFELSPQVDSEIPSPVSGTVSRIPSGEGENRHRRIVDREISGAARKAAPPRPRHPPSRCPSGEVPAPASKGSLLSAADPTSPAPAPFAGLTPARSSAAIPVRIPGARAPRRHPLPPSRCGGVFLRPWVRISPTSGASTWRRSGGPAPGAASPSRRPLPHPMPAAEPSPEPDRRAAIPETRSPSPRGSPGFSGRGGLAAAHPLLLRALDRW